MSLRTRTAQVVIGAIALGVGWAWLQSPPSGPPPGLKHPNPGSVRFIVRYGPPWEEGGPRGVAWSWQVGRRTGDDGTTYEPDKEVGVGIVPARSGEIVTMAAAPARPWNNVPETVCIIRYGDIELGRSAEYGAGGCGLSRTIP